ncbi:MAG: hypothetical protein FWF85_02375 [Clostridiales bacterium]|nr:hypothetical protein [Clostridiales bacterium]
MGRAAMACGRYPASVETQALGDLSWPDKELGLGIEPAFGRKLGAA